MQKLYRKINYTIFYYTFTKYNKKFKFKHEDYSASSNNYN